jgi:hypothetical protein
VDKRSEHFDVRKPEIEKVFREGRDISISKIRISSLRESRGQEVGIHALVKPERNLDCIHMYKGHMDQGSSQGAN